MRRVQALLTSHAHQVGLLENAMGGVVSGLKELGDLGNWVGAVERLAEEVVEIKADVEGTR